MISRKSRPALNLNNCTRIRKKEQKIGSMDKYKKWLSGYYDATSMYFVLGKQLKV